MTIRLATHPSALAMQQTLIVASRLKAVTRRPVELVELTTTGDWELDTPIGDLAELGSFVKALQETVLAGDADAAVHPAKDIPSETHHQLVIAADPERVLPPDVLVGTTVALGETCERVGAQSARR